MTKLSIFKDGRFWLAKSHVDFTKETGLTQNQQRKKLKVMEDLGLVTTRVWKFNAVPTLHVSINSEVYNQMHMEAMHKRFGISEEPAEYADFDPSDDENLDDY